MSEYKCEACGEEIESFEAIERCAICDEYLCEECIMEYKGVQYCGYHKCQDEIDREKKE